MKPKVFVTRKVPEAGLKLLRTRFDVEINPDDRVLTKAELIEGVRGKDALLCLLTDTVDAEVIQSNTNLRAISNYAVGFNNIDVGEATKHGIPVTNTPGILNDTTADFAFLLLMAAARRLVEGDSICRKNAFPGWGPEYPVSYTHLTLPTKRIV